jgi:hypothetical protein
MSGGRSKNADYIGDGVYVDFDGYQIEVRANSPDNPMAVALEPAVMRSLIRYAVRMGVISNAQ